MISYSFYSSEKVETHPHIYSMQRRELTKRECDRLADELANLIDDFGDKLDYLSKFLNRRHPDAQRLLGEMEAARAKACNYYEGWLGNYYTITTYERYSQWVQKTRRKWESIIGK